MRKATVEIQIGYGTTATRRITVEGYTCEVAGLSMVVHRPVWHAGSANEEVRPPGWTVTEPTTGYSIFDSSWQGPVSTRQEAIAEAERRVRNEGGARAVRGRIRRVLAQSPFPKREVERG